MENFVKITEEILEKDTNYKNYLVEKVEYQLFGDECDYDYRMMEAIIDCESPVEQLLAIEMEKIDLKCINFYNPFIDIIDIEKQVDIKCGRNKYRVDFQIPVIYKNQENIMFVIECDGHEFHQKTKEQVEKDNKRQRDLQEAGYEVIRFSGTEIWHRPYKCACEVKNIILSKCKYINNNKFDKTTEKEK